MLRKHPDAVALTILGFVLLIASIPRMVLRETEQWKVRPLTVEIPHAEIRQERDRLKEEIRREIRAHRDEIKEALNEAKEAIRH